MVVQTWREQMKIEIAEPGRMTQTGSSLLKLIQNNDMPVLDLLVRESIQNSLDARKANSKYVDVNYLTGTFDNNKLSAELEGITHALKKQFPAPRYNFIAARDTNTVGLTGELDYKKVKNNDYGNLLKLIYEICKPQETEGAGGSWGLGKTVYFRIGIGLVVYYSRISVGSGKYASRLAASYVEDETKSDAMIPIYQDQAKRGIAWWGESVGENITQAITDEKTIADFLKIFDINPYVGEETGTTIIIPYTDSESLLKNNQIEYLNGKGKVVEPFWTSSLEDYLKIATQRWYAPRLNNPHYNSGAYLRLKVNNTGLGYDHMEPTFKVIQALYNRANHIDEDDILTNAEAITKVSGIKVIKYLTDTQVGTLAYTKVPKELLGMKAPDNKPEPFMYFNCEIRDEEVNKPIICFTRKPAMIVSYENVGAWASNFSLTSKDEYILALFVLNSYNQMKNSPTPRSLEEYVRRSEMADHTSWSDWSEGTYNPRIITKIQSNVNKIISKEFAPVETNMKPKENSGLGKLFGEMLLPPDGFGKRPGPGTKSPANPPNRRGVNFRVDDSKIKYLSDTMIIPLILETSGKKKISRIGFDIQIDSESKKIEMQEWENKLNLNPPFEIKDCKIEVTFLDGQKVNGSGVIIKDSSEVRINNILFKKKSLSSGTCCGMSIESEENHSINARIMITVSIHRKDVKPVFVFEKGEANV